MTAPPTHPRAVNKLVWGLLAGLVVFFLLPHALALPTRLLLGWVAFCVMVLARLWTRIRGVPPEHMGQVATMDDETRSVASAVVLIAAVVSLVGVGFALHDANAKGISAAQSVGLTGLAVLTVAASWLLVHSEYTLHYARQFYKDGGGVNFPDKDDEDGLKQPVYRDFAYLAFTLGMTYQVSDTDLNTSAMRRLALLHSLLSYVFGTVIVAVTINGVAGIISAN